MACLKFKAWLVQNGIKQKDVAELLGIAEENLSAKINGRQNFTLAQVKVICEHYKISADIFLT